MQKIPLNDNWKLTMEDLSVTRDLVSSVYDKRDGWMDCNLPCDVHMPLISHGLIKDPTEALNCYDAEWTATKSWWFKREIHVPKALYENDVLELTLESLDIMADIFINGKYIAAHKSAFYPFCADVKKHLQIGDNTLLIRVSTGLEHVDMATIEEIAPSAGPIYDDLGNPRGDVRRLALRKPQYVYGWDWCPKVNTCGITGNAFITAYNPVAIRGVRVFTEEINPNAANLGINLEIENLHVFESFDADINIQISFEGNKWVSLSKTEHLRSGLNFIKYKAAINNPMLWWPNGMGAQNLYKLAVDVSNNQGSDCFHTDFGVRTITINMEPIDTGRRFAICVNGVDIFCKGANWVPADLIYARVSKEKYDSLVKEAKEANFNMLRVWGGGLYENEAFYAACNKHGLLVWQDFMFACGMYPDYLDEFCLLMEKELDYQTKGLRNHPSIALFCGNNENSWAFQEWWPDITAKGIFGGHVCYNKLMPSYIEKNCPSIPYWNGSPYGGKEPNGNEAGDRHHWSNLWTPDQDRRTSPEAFDQVESKFVSEYGYIGPPVLSSIEKYHAGAPIDMQGDIWKLHTGTYEKGEAATVNLGIARHYTDEFDLQGYLLYGSLCQGLMYQYSLEAIRAKLFCGGSLFWMYNDAWGEVGWSVIDYYLKRKPCYYYVKRAFAPVKMILRKRDEAVVAICINDGPEALTLPMEYGYVSFDGRFRQTERTDIILPAYSRFEGIIFDIGGHDSLSGTYFMRDLSGRADIALLRQHEFRRLIVPEPVISVSDVVHRDNGAIITLKAETFCHGIHFKGLEEFDFSDLYFDMLPGDEKTIALYNPPEGLSANDLLCRGCLVKNALHQPSFRAHVSLI